MKDEIKNHVFKFYREDGKYTIDPKVVEEIKYKKEKNKKLLPLMELQEIAEFKGGKCLSTEYINNHTKLQWQCKENHIWWASSRNIKYGKWCPKCARVQKLTIEEMQEIARSRGGKCLSTEYINCRNKLQWQCKEGHIWWTTSNTVKNGSWCPKCSIKKGKTKDLITKKLNLEKKLSEIQKELKLIEEKIGGMDIRYSSGDIYEFSQERKEWADTELKDY